MTKLSGLFLVLALIFYFASNTHSAFAQGGTLPACDSLPAGQSVLQWPHCTIFVLGQLIVTVIDGALIFGSLILLFNLLKSSMDYITSGDDTDKLKQARMNVTWSVVGIFGIASVYIIFDFLLDLIPGLDSLLL